MYIKLPWYYHAIPSLYHWSVPVKLLRQCFKTGQNKKHSFVQSLCLGSMPSLKADTTALSWLQTAGACPLCLLLSQSSVERLHNSWTSLIDAIDIEQGVYSQHSLNQCFLPLFFYFSPTSVTLSFLLFGSYIFSSLFAPPPTSLVSLFPLT